MEKFEHYSVLLNESIDGLNIKPDGIYVDCTLGGAGHSSVILSKLNENGHLYAFDQDRIAIENAEAMLATYIEKGMVTLIKANFRNIKEELETLGVYGVDGILYDLGVSSPQLDQAERGFSYRYDAPLDMRMDQEQELTARVIVNEWPFGELVKIFYRYGEEKFSKQIARKIEKIRETHRSRRPANWSKSSKTASLRLPEERVGTRPNAFFKLCESPSMMNCPLLKIR